MHRVLIAAIALGWACGLRAQDSIEVRLNQSPRHQEWVKIKNGGRQINAFLVFPEVAGRALVVVVIHENRGLTDWVRSVADRLAEAGHIAIAPDLLSGAGPQGGGTEAFSSPDSARQAIYQLPPEQVIADLRAVVEYVGELPAANGKVAVAGFCWGGGQAFSFATVQPGLAAAFVFYGPAPADSAAVAHISAPVYGFYGGTDARINAALPAITAQMRQAGKFFEPVVYEGAGHGFLRAGEAADANPADRSARAAGWNRWLGVLAGL